MKALIVSNLYHPNLFGGAERSAQYLAEGLAAQGHDIAVATLNPRKRDDVADVNGVRVYYLPVRNIYFPSQPGKPKAAKMLWHAVDTYNPFMAASLGRVLDAERPEVVNTHNLAGFSATAWRAAKARGLPLVHTAHDQYVLCPKSTMHRKGVNCANPCFECRIYSAPRARLSRLVDVLIAPSRFVLDRCAHYQLFPNAEKMVIYNSSEPAAQPGSGVRQQDRPLRFGFLGRLHTTKGVELLIRSFQKLPAGQARLTIAGRGMPAYERKLRKLVNNHSGITWLGLVVPEVLLSQTDVLVVPSLWHDPAPLVILESLAHRLPVIGSRRGGIPDLMGEGTGWLFDPDELGALPRALEQAIQSRSELAAMGARAGERARQFSAETMVEGYMKAYSRAIAKNTKRS
jgi:glycosyltransferase involved in cell wall biosynthesis